MRKYLYTTILLAALFSMVEVRATAESVKIDGIYYNFSDTDATVTYCNDFVNSGNVIIPESITYNEKTYSVTAIGNDAFHDCYNLTSIEIPNSVERIGRGAFIYCSGLTSIIIPNSIITIGESAFYGCTGIETVEFHCKEIGDWFNEMENLKNVVIGDEVTTIGYQAFYCCSGLTSVTIPNSVTSIGNNVFYNCFGLTSVAIGNSVTSIGIAPFYGCYNLTEISVASSNTKYDSRDNCNAIIETASNTLISGCKNTFIPNSVTNIAENAFCGCLGLTSIEIPASVTSIGHWAFEDCSGLKKVIIKDISAWCEMELDWSSNPLNYAKHLYSDDDTEVTNLVIPDGVASIGNYTFYGCSGLTSVEIPNSVESIRHSAFFGCTGLTNVTIGEGVTDIGDEAFRNCSGLIKIEIPASVTSIGYWTFFGCKALVDVYCHPKDAISVAINSFDDSCFDNITLHVPAESIDLYKDSIPWKYFKDIVAIESSDISQPNTTGFASEKIVCRTIDGKKLNGEPTKKGVYIVNGRKLIVK